MNILIVDDNAGKIAAVEELLNTSCPTGTLTISTAKSFLGALRLLKERAYDLLVLDLVLPIRDNERAEYGGGRKVLAEIMSGVECLRPSHIICLTEHEDAGSSMSDIVQLNLAHVVIYTTVGESWRGALGAKVQYVKARLEAEARLPADFRSDLLVITSSSQHEFHQFLKLPAKFITEFNQDDSLYYAQSEWTRSDGKKLNIVGCAAPAMGMTAACATACKAIARWRPRYLVMTGIAAGTSDKLSFGDILVAESAYDYGSGKILDTADRGRLFTPSPRQLNISSDLQAILQRWETEQRCMDTIWRGWETRPEKPPKLAVGLIASGAAVVQSKDLVDEILTSSRKVVGLDMEAYAIFQAANLAARPTPKVLVAKSVSDFADNAKGDHWQPYAAYTSARFVFEFFTKAEDLAWNPDT